MSFVICSHSHSIEFSKKSKENHTRDEATHCDASAQCMLELHYSLSTSEVSKHLNLEKRISLDLIPFLFTIALNNEENKNIELPHYVVHKPPKVNLSLFQIFII